MKIRRHFVSNSSATSFTICGWPEKDLGEQSEIQEKIKQIDKTINLVGSLSESYGWIYGVGESDEPYGEDWEDIVLDGPKDEEVKKLSQVATQLGLPQPQFYQETWFNG